MKNEIDYAVMLKIQGYAERESEIAAEKVRKYSEKVYEKSNKLYAKYEVLYTKYYGAKPMSIINPGSIISIIKKAKERGEL